MALFNDVITPKQKITQKQYFIIMTSSVMLEISLVLKICRKKNDLILILKNVPDCDKRH